MGPAGDGGSETVILINLFLIRQLTLQGFSRPVKIKYFMINFGGVGHKRKRREGLQPTRPKYGR